MLLCLSPLYWTLGGHHQVFVDHNSFMNGSLQANFFSLRDFAQVFGCLVGLKDEITGMLGISLAVDGEPSSLNMNNF